MMIGIKNLWEDFSRVIKYHPISTGLMLVTFLIQAVILSGGHKYAAAVENLTFCLAFGALLCEAINYERQGREKALKKERYYFVIYPVVGLLSLAYSVFYSYKAVIEKSCDSLWSPTIPYQSFICYFVLTVCLSVYFFFKKEGKDFEEYCCKSFLGLLKAELVYLLVAVGILFIILTFNTLIYNTDAFLFLERAELLLIGLLQYPCLLLGLSKTGEKVSAFSKILFSYVLTAILAVAFLVVYLYIFKIVITRALPKNEVFLILSLLFIFGLPIWTLALGICDDKIKKPISFFPFFFAPFIILQLICLYIRVSAYGFTRSRYLGAALIVFESAYLILYTFAFISKKKLTHLLLFIIIAETFLIFFMPFINMEEVIINSQKKKLISYLEMGDKAPENIKNSAVEAYSVIYEQGEERGRKYLENNVSEEEKIKIRDMDEDGYIDDYFYINSQNILKELNVEKYKRMVFVSGSYGEYDADESRDIDIKKLALYDYNDNVVDYADLSSLIGEMREIYLEYQENEELCNSKLDEMISKDIILPSGNVLIIGQ
nr:DUF4153 domain-containing protein [Lachnospiraceae bacterium]